MGLMTAAIFAIERYGTPFATPDDFGPLKASDLYNYDRWRVLTDAHRFIVPTILCLAALFLWLALRLVFVGSVGRMRRLIRLWFEVKEHELRTRAGRGRPPDPN
jgi:hypothetical protein